MNTSENRLGSSSAEELVPGIGTRWGKLKQIVSGFSLAVLTACGGGGDPTTVAASPVSETPPTPVARVLKVDVTKGEQAIIVALDGDLSNVSGLPTGTTWDPSTNTITIAPGTLGTTGANTYKLNADPNTQIGLSLNDKPKSQSAIEDTLTPQSTPVSVDILSHYADINGDTMTIKAATSNQGTVSITGGSVSFTPNPGFAGNATITGIVDDGRGGEVAFSATVKVSLPATLPDIGPIDDNGGGGLSFSIHMPVVRDTNNQMIPYVITGLPLVDGVGYTTNWTITQTIIGNETSIAISGVYAGGIISGDINTIPLTLTSPGAVGTTTENVNIRTY